MLVDRLSAPSFVQCACPSIQHDRQLARVVCDLNEPIRVVLGLDICARIFLKRVRYHLIYSPIATTRNNVNRERAVSPFSFWRALRVSADSSIYHTYSSTKYVAAVAYLLIEHA